jgi:hypothetical protein
MPANQVEMSSDTLIHLAINPESWSGLIGQGQIRASGLASDLSQLFIQVSAKYPGWNLKFLASNGVD